MGLFGNHARAGASAAGVYEIDRSLRFNSSDSTVLTQDLGTSATNRKKTTISFWYKPSALGGGIIHGGVSGTGGSSTGSRIYHQSTGKLYIQTAVNNSSVWAIETTRVLRDFSAWYHIVLQVDTTQGTDTNRVKLYINGEQETAFDSASYPTQDYDDYWVYGKFRIGDYGGDYGYYYGMYGYLAEIHVIDGTAALFSDFGEEDANTGQWIPKKYVGTYGTNGFYVDFEDNSGTTTTTLGKDSSGNSNNFTCNNFSVAAGAGNDSLTDTPTNNFCTINPLYPTNVTCSNGNLDVSTGNADAWGASTFKIPETGKWFYECTLTSANNPYGGQIGAAIYDGNARIGYYNNGQKVVNGTWSSYGDTLTTNDVVGTAINRDDGEVTFYKNGTSQGTITSCFTAGKEYYVIATDGSSSAGDTYSFNFGQRAFAHSAPTGYKTLCTANLPTPTIEKSTDFFNVNLWSGNAGTQSITMDFQPDMVWNKCRTATHDHQRWDALRGVTKSLRQDMEVEATHADGLTAFNSNGFTLGANSRNNGSGETYVGWSWKESATAGFDMVKDEGTGSDHTIAHSLGVKPDMMIRKGIDRVDHWQVYHKDLDGADATEYLEFDDDSVQQNYHEIWNDTPPTSSVFTVGSDTSVNEDGKNYITYLFSSVEGFSKVGRYTGNGATDGIFVYLGFKPAFLLMKRINTSEDWIPVDNKRDPDNPVANYLRMNTNAAAADGVAYDFISNGVKFRGSSQNENNEAYIYLAFAERPFKYANAR